MKQQCGQTWLQTFKKINAMYNSSKQLDALQLVTWNDYEEGTEIETGIDNCLSVSASMAGRRLQWAVKGNEDTVDHYTVFVSTDGENLMELTQVAPGNHSIELGSYSVAAGHYTLYVQAVGKPVFRNHMSQAVKYTASGILLGASPSTLTVARGQSATLQVSVSASGMSVNTPVALACSNLPAGATCSFSPSSVTPGQGTARANLTITASGLAANRPSGPLYAVWLPFGFAGMFLLESRKLRKAALAVLMLGLLLVACSCGGGSMMASPSNMSQAVAQGTYAVTISGNSSAAQNSTTVMLSIR